MVIELQSRLDDMLPWIVRHQTGTNAPGTIVKLPLEGETGFYRVRFVDQQQPQRTVRDIGKYGFTSSPVPKCTIARESAL